MSEITGDDREAIGRLTAVNIPVNAVPLECGTSRSVWKSDHSLSGLLYRVGEHIVL